MDEEERREADIEVLIEQGLLKRCREHDDYVIDAKAGDGDDVPYAVAEARGISRQRVRELINEHGSECPECTSARR